MVAEAQSPSQHATRVEASEVSHDSPTAGVGSTIQYSILWLAMMGRLDAVTTPCGVGLQTRTLLLQLFADFQ